MKTFIANIIVSLAAAFAVVAAAHANDGVYFTTGNFLVPVYPTNISVAKEVLSITIGKDGFATVDVYYEFLNGGDAENMTMAFEASAPYNDLSPINRKGVHPYIKDFTVCMNGTVLPYRNAVVACKDTEVGHNVDFTPLDPDKWKGYGEVPDSVLPENNAVYNQELDSVTAFAYAYYFNAQFKSGKNIVHHTYRYRMSYTVLQDFVIPYWLTPAQRWANRQVDDFTLRIASESAAEFCLVDTLFRSAPFKSVRGGKLLHFSDENGESLLYANLQQGDTVVWHGMDFKPSANMFISSPTWKMGGNRRKWLTSQKVVVAADGSEYCYVGHDANSYYVEDTEVRAVPKSGSRVEERSAFAGQGVVCVDGGVARRVNVRKRPSSRSRVLSVVDAGSAEKPTVYPCLGMVDANDKDGGFSQWFKVRVGNKVGYVNRDLMLWMAF